MVKYITVTGMSFGLVGGRLCVQEFTDEVTRMDVMNQDLYPREFSVTIWKNGVVVLSASSWFRGGEWTTLASKQLPEGTYTYRFSTPVGGREGTFSIIKRTSVTFNVSPAEVVVHVWNVKDYGKKTTSKGTITFIIEPGTYNFMISKNGYSNVVGSFSIPYGEERSYDVALAVAAVVVFNTIPPATLRILKNAKEIGAWTTPATIPAEPNVKHTFEISTRCYKSIVGSFVLSPGEEKVFNYALEHVSEPKVPMASIPGTYIERNAEPGDLVRTVAGLLQVGYAFRGDGNYVTSGYDPERPEVKLVVHKSASYNWRKNLGLSADMGTLLTVAEFGAGCVTYASLPDNAKKIASYLGWVPKEELVRLTNPSKLLEFVGIVGRYLTDGYEVASVGPLDITFLKTGDKVHLDVEFRDVGPYVNVGLLPESYFFNCIVDIALVKLGRRALAAVSDYAKRSVEFLKIIPPPPPVIPVIPPEEVVPPKIPILPILLIGGGLAAGAYLLLRKKR